MWHAPREGDSEDLAGLGARTGTLPQDSGVGGGGEVHNGGGQTVGRAAVKTGPRPACHYRAVFAANKACTASRSKASEPAAYKVSVGKTIRRPERSASPA
jgi:hypothetical protein